MNNERPHEWDGPSHKDNVLNGALVVALKVGLLFALLQGTVPFQVPAVVSADLAVSADA
ncbi:MAG TPA: hypothetical protein VNU21_17585 [Usitatibacter sp.]|jgi:hypothetical protein|nr:hypothetical protein [Usitatibacter sp.]